MAVGRKTGGRQPGSMNKRSAARQQAMDEKAALIEGVLGAAFTGDAHALLMAVYKDTTQPIELRVDAAKAAVRFEKPALASAEVIVRDPLAAMSDEQLTAMRRHAAALMAAGVTSEVLASS